VSAQPRTPPTQAPANGATTGVAPTVCYEPSPVGADPCVCPTANATHTGTRQRGNHRGLPLRFAMNHRPSGRTPVSAQPTGNCPYAIWTVARCTITRRSGPLCPPNHQRHPHSQRGNHRRLPLRFAMNHCPSGRTPVSAHLCLTPLRQTPVWPNLMPATSQGRTTQNRLPFPTRTAIAGGAFPGEAALRAAVGARSPRQRTLELVLPGTVISPIQPRPSQKQQPCRPRTPASAAQVAPVPAQGHSEVPTPHTGTAAQAPTADASPAACFPTIPIGPSFRPSRARHTIAEAPDDWGSGAAVPSRVPTVASADTGSGQ
jgi:hypothetical protein